MGLSHILFAVLLVLQFGDWWSSARAKAAGGHEANPVMAWAMARIGFGATFMVKIAVVAAFGWLLVQCGQPGVFMLALLIAVYIWVVWHILKAARVI